MSEMICYADILKFLRDFGCNVEFSDYDEGVIVYEWNYELPRNNDILKFLLQKYPVSISSYLDSNNTIRIVFCDKNELAFIERS